MDNTSKDTPLIPQSLCLGLTLGIGIGKQTGVAPDLRKQQGKDSEDE